MPARHLLFIAIVFASGSIDSLQAVELTVTDSTAAADQIHVSQAGTTVTISDTPPNQPRVVAYPDQPGTHQTEAYASEPRYANEADSAQLATQCSCGEGGDWGGEGGCGCESAGAGGGWSYDGFGGDVVGCDGGCGGNCDDCIDCNRNGCRKGIVLDSWLSQGLTWNPDDPRNNFNLPVTFNDRANEYQMNQLYLALGREVSTSSSWDVGGRVDLLYGTDYFFTQANGLETRSDGSPRWNSSDGPRGTGAAMYGLAMPQLYAEFFAPIGPGVRIKAGHFYTTIGYESVMAPQNFFYSHAYTMQYGEPFTHTGVLAEVSLTRRLDMHAGFTRGWDNWEDNNGKLGFLGGFAWTAPSERASVALTVTSSNEDDAGQNNRTVYSLVYTRRIGCRVQYVLQHDFGVEENGEIDRSGNPSGAKWYGINNYLTYEWSDALSFGLRVEWFRDQDNARVLGIPLESIVQGGNYNEVTLGANWKMTPRLTLRKEFRFDWSDVNAPNLPGNGVYNDFTAKNQFTAAADLIFRF